MRKLLRPPLALLGAGSLALGLASGYSFRRELSEKLDQLNLVKQDPILVLRGSDQHPWEFNFDPHVLGIASHTSAPTAGASSEQIYAINRDLLRTDESEKESSLHAKSRQKIEVKSEKTEAASLAAHRKPQNWEFKKVQVDGFYLPGLHLIRKERKGVPGYLIFKGFTTSLNDIREDYDEEDDDEPFQTAEFGGVMVNIGWIPATKKINLEPEYECPGEAIYLQEGEFSKKFLHGQKFLQDASSGIKYSFAKKEGEEEEEPAEGGNPRVGQLLRITGFLRKSEEKSFLKGRWTDEYHSQQNQINLRRMARNYDFYNDPQMGEYYIAIASENPKTDSKNVPITMDLNKPENDLTDFVTETKIQKNLGKIELVGVGLLAAAALV